MRIQKLEQLRELIREGWGLDATSGNYTCQAGENLTCKTILLQGNYRLKSPSGDIIPVEYCKGDLDEHTFKIGDKVRCKPGYNTNSDNSSPLRGGSGYVSGYEFIVSGIDRGTIVWEKDKNKGHLARCLELVETKVEEIKPKVGMRVMRGSRCEAPKEFDRGVITTELSALNR